MNKTKEAEWDLKESNHFCKEKSSEEGWSHKPTEIWIHKHIEVAGSLGLWSNGAKKFLYEMVDLSLSYYFNKSLHKVWPTAAWGNSLYRAEGTERWKDEDTASVLRSNIPKGKLKGHLCKIWIRTIKPGMQIGATGKPLVREVWKN